MESRLFRQSRSLQHANLKSNTCINEKFSSLEMLSKIVDKNCERTDPVEDKPICETIGKCHLGKKCCRLSKFKSASRLELKALKRFVGDLEVDAITYDSNPDVEYLLHRIASSFLYLKVYDASNCAVRAIFWKNFHLLRDLESINLASNQISSFNGELFHEMPLKILNLCNYTLISISP